MVACHKCGEETERPMLKKYCTACYWRVKRAAERECGLPELHGHGKARRCLVCASYASLSSAHSEMPSKKRSIELYLASPRCAVTGHAFDPLADPEQLLPTPVRADQSGDYTERNLVFVARFIGNSMRNGHATLSQCKAAVAALQWTPNPPPPLGLNRSMGRSA
jgi:hypothetical protein